MATATKHVEWAVQVPDAQGGVMYLPAPLGEQDANAIADMYADQNPAVVSREVTPWKKETKKPKGKN